MIRWLVGSLLAFALLLGGTSSFTATAAASEGGLGTSLVKADGQKGGKHKGKKGGKKKGKRRGGNKNMAAASA